MSQYRKDLTVEVIGLRANCAVKARLNRDGFVCWPGYYAKIGFLRKMLAFRHTSRISRHGHSHGQPEQTAKAPSPSGR